jgi:hypothetical protein
MRKEQIENDAKRLKEKQVKEGRKEKLVRKEI